MFSLVCIWLNGDETQREIYVQRLKGSISFVSSFK